MAQLLQRIIGKVTAAPQAGADQARVAVAEPVALAARPLLRTDGFAGRGDELARLEALAGEGASVVWVTGSPFSGKSWLISRFLRTAVPEAVPARFVLRRGASRDAFLEGVADLLRRRRAQTDPKQAGEASFDAARSWLIALSRLRRARAVIVVESFEEMQHDPDWRWLIEQASHSSGPCLLLVESCSRPEWAEDAPGVVLAPGAMPDPQAHLAQTLTAASEAARSLWAALSLLPGAVTPEAAEYICRRPVSDAWRELLAAGALQVDGTRGTLHPLARAAGAAYLESREEQRIGLATRIIRHYRRRPSRESSPDATSPDVENYVAAAWLAYEQGRLRDLLAIRQFGAERWGKRLSAYEGVTRLCCESARRRRDAAAYAHCCQQLWPLLWRRREAAEMERHCRESLSLPLAQGSYPLRCVALHNLGSALHARDEDEQAESHYRESLDISQAAGQFLWQSATLRSLALLREKRGDPHQAEALLLQHLKLERRRGPLLGIAQALAALAWLAERQGRTAQAEARYQEALGEARRAADWDQEVNALRELVRLAELRGRPDEADTLVEASLEAARQSAAPVALAVVLTEAGHLALHRGDLDRAEQLYLEAQQSAWNVDGQWLECVALHSLAMVVQDRGQFAQAERLWREVVAIDDDLGSGHAGAPARHNLAMVLREQGRLDEAEALAQDVLSTSADGDDRLLTALARHELGRLAVERGRLEEAGRFYRESLDQFRRLGQRRLEGCALRGLGELARRTCRLDEAEQLCRQSVEVAQTVRARPQEAEALRELAFLAEARGDLSFAVEHMAQAVAMLEGMGYAGRDEAASDLARLRALFASSA